MRAFKGNPHGLLMGVRTMWEGIDIPGPDLSHVWIAKLPFPNMADPLLRARQERLQETNSALNPFERQVHSRRAKDQALVQLINQLGPTDSAIVAALAHLAEPPPYKQFLAALRGQERYGVGGRYSLRRYLLAADWFGRLQYVPAGRVEAALEELCGRGLVVTEQATWASDNGVHTFERLLLTEAGLAAYKARRLPDTPDTSDVLVRWRSA